MSEPSRTTVHVVTPLIKIVPPLPKFNEKSSKLLFIRPSSSVLFDLLFSLYKLTQYDGLCLPQYVDSVTPFRCIPFCYVPVVQSLV